MPRTTVASIYSSLPVPSQDYKDRRHVLAIGGGNLKVQQIILQDKFLPSGNVEPLLIVGSHSGFIVLELPAIFLRSVDPLNNTGNDRVTALGSHQILVSKIPEILVLLYYLGVPDNHLLIYTFALFNHVNVGRLIPGSTTVPVYRDKGTPPKKGGGSSFTVTKLPSSLEPKGQRPLSLPHSP